ncbi:MAG TPA: alpha-galactosidase [Abditibacteriaceae bacterium]
MSLKIAMIGAGSVVFSKNLTGDILGFPEFKDATLAYMDIDAERLQVGADLCRKVAKAVGATPTIIATQDRREAVKDADFVINMVQIGGFDSTLVDFEIPRKYGLKFTIADTTGPGGLFRALRTFPMLKGLAQDIEELAPNAVLLNYSNPMSMNMLTVNRTSNIRSVGLCHSVQGTFNELMGYLGENPDDMAFICAGINHMAFYQRIEKNGVDLYPRLFEAMEDPKIYKSNKVRFELMRRLGYFVTESSEHNAEYSSFFMPHGEKVISDFDVPIDEYLRRCDGIVDEFDRMKVLAASDEEMKVHRSHEYGSLIIHSMMTGTPRVVYGNMPNNGAISNLPNDAIVECPTLVDRAGLQFTTVGALDPQLVGYMYPHITQQELFIRAATEGRRDHVYQACMNDPLTAATMPLDKIVEMCDELIEGHGDFLPKLDKKTLVPTSGKQFSPPTPQELRASWDAAQAEKVEDFISDFQIIGPFFGPEKDAVSIDVPTQLEADFLQSGTVDFDRTLGDVKWKPAQAQKGFVNLLKEIADVENAVAYAAFEVESIHQRETVLKTGSDDGIKVWLNGEEVLRIDTNRGHRAGEDETPIFLKAGTNTFLVKIDQKNGGWGFSVQVPKANF